MLEGGDGSSGDGDGGETVVEARTAVEVEMVVTVAAVTAVAVAAATETSRLFYSSLTINQRTSTPFVLMLKEANYIPVKITSECVHNCSKSHSEILFTIYMLMILCGAVYLERW